MGAGHSHGHAHDHGGFWNFPLNTIGRQMAIVLGGFVFVTIVGLVLLWPDGTAELPAGFDPDVEYTAATVTALGAQTCFGFDSNGPTCDTVAFSIDDGPNAGDSWTTEFSRANTATPEFEPGDRVVLVAQPEVPDERFQYYFVDFERKNSIWVLAALFAVAIIALGRMVGVRALISLALSLLVLIVFMLPSILEGRSPVVVALVGSAAVAFVALYLTHGFNHLTTVALLGSFASLAVTGLLAWLFLSVADITGLADEDAAFLQFGSNNVNLQGLLLAGVVIGTLGVLDDVTITQASAVSEIHNANADYGFSKLYNAALRVGRAHIASTVNTLVLAYAGASLPLLLLFTQSQQPLSQVLNSELVAVEIIRTLVGSIGLVAAIPLTTALAAIVVGHDHGDDHDHHHGNDHDHDHDDHHHDDYGHDRHDHDEHDHVAVDQEADESAWLRWSDDQR